MRPEDSRYTDGLPVAISRMFGMGFVSVVGRNTLMVPASFQSVTSFVSCILRG